MNKVSNFCVCAIALSALAFVACDKETVVEIVEAPTPPALLLSTSIVTTPLSGGSYSFTYSVLNPAGDGAVSCSSDVAWIADIEQSSGTVSFTVAENMDEDSRSGCITVSYSSSAGNTSEQVTVVQHAGAVPVLEVSSPSMTLEPEEGTYSFTYTLTNPADDGVLECSVDVDWVSDFDTSVEGVVSFTVAENVAEELRSANVTLAYTYTYATITKGVSLVQDYHGGANGIPDYSDLIGTYEASGLVVEGADLVETTWKLIIADNGSLGVYIWGLTPSVSNLWLTESPFFASASLDRLNRLVVPSQFLMNVTVDYYIVGYTPCTGYSDEYVYYGTEDDISPDLTFTYDEAEGVWVSDYGIFLAEYFTRVWSAFIGYVDAVVPSVTLRKVSSTIDTESVVPESTAVSEETNWTLDHIQAPLAFRRWGTDTIK